jgi:hypothetical protein
MRVSRTRVTRFNSLEQQASIVPPRDDEMDLYLRIPELELRHRLMHAGHAFPVQSKARPASFQSLNGMAESVSDLFGSKNDSSRRTESVVLFSVSAKKTGEPCIDQMALSCAFQMDGYPRILAMGAQRHKELKPVERTRIYPLMVIGISRVDSSRPCVRRSNI